MMKRIMIVIALMVATSALFNMPVIAGNFPRKSVKIVVPFKPGGGSDLSARLFAKYASKYLPKDVVVTNITGGAGKVAQNAVLKARADGYTLLWAHNALHMTYIAGMTEYTWDSFTPVYMPVTAPYGFYTTKNAPYSNMKEFIQHAKANPGELRLGFAPIGNSHYAVLKVVRGANLSMSFLKPLPMSGDKNRIVAMLQGNMSVSAITASAAKPYVESGDLKLIGILSDERPPGSSSPTIKEQGVDAVEFFKYVAYAPKKTPDDRVNVLRTAFRKASYDPEMKTEMKKALLYPAHLGGKDLEEDLESDYQSYKKLAYEFGIVKKK